MMRRSSSSVVQFVTPAALTTFSSNMTEPTSLPPKRRPIWQTFGPCVTQVGCHILELVGIEAQEGRDFYWAAILRDIANPASYTSL